MAKNYHKGKHLNQHHAEVIPYQEETEKEAPFLTTRESTIVSSEDLEEFGQDSSSLTPTYEEGSAASR